MNQIRSIAKSHNRRCQYSPQWKMPTTYPNAYRLIATLVLALVSVPSFAAADIEQTESPSPVIGAILFQPDQNSETRLAHTPPPDEKCHLIGTIDRRIDLDNLQSKDELVELRKLISDLGANFAFMQKPSSKSWSRIYHCL